MTKPDHNLPQPLATVIRDFLYVEWYELDELAKKVKAEPSLPWVEDFKLQLKSLSESHHLPLEEINQLSGQEFEGEEEARVWLKAVQKTVFGA